MEKGGELYATAALTTRENDTLSGPTGEWMEAKWRLNKFTCSKVSDL
jgi:hypothetical protein